MARRKILVGVKYTKMKSLKKYKGRGKCRKENKSNAYHFTRRRCQEKLYKNKHEKISQVEDMEEDVSHEGHQS